MVSSIKAAILISLAIYLGQIIVVSQSAKPCATLEFRLAEDKPGKGLTEAVMPRDKKKLYLHKEALITNKDIAEAHAYKHYYYEGVWMDEDLLKMAKGDITKSKIRCGITLVFTKEGAERIERISQEYQLKVLAILVDGEVIFAPTIQGRINDRASLNDEGLPYDEAEGIAKKINSRCK